MQFSNQGTFKAGASHRKRNFLATLQYPMQDQLVQRSTMSDLYHASVVKRDNRVMTGGSHSSTWVYPICISTSGHHNYYNYLLDFMYKKYRTHDIKHKKSKLNMTWLHNRYSETKWHHLGESMDLISPVPLIFIIQFVAVVFVQGVVVLELCTIYPWQTWFCPQSS